MSRLELITIQLFSIVLVFSTCNPSIILRRFERITDQNQKNVASKVPYMVRIFQSDEFGQRYVCSGALLSPNFVITAAHCVSGLPVETITVRGGDVLLQSTSVPTRRVVHISTPREFGENFKEVDIAILKVDPPFLNENPYVHPIPLCDSKMNTGDIMYVSGYERLTEKATYMSWRQCAKLYGGTVNVTRGMFCGVPETHSRVCNNDAGGPVVHNGRLCGILMWGSGWLESSNPEVYISITPVRKFIEYILSET